MKNFRKSRVLIVDDHPIVREGMVPLINRETDLEVCAEADNAVEALKAVRELQPDVAVIDISMEGMNGLQLARIIASKHKSIAVLILSMHDEQFYAERALSAGAKGYVMKQEASRKVVAAIRAILAGKTYVSEAVAARLLRKQTGKGRTATASPFDLLTDREIEVFRLIGLGLRPAEIGEKLCLSVKTIETHREHIKNKLNISTAAELVQQAIAWVHSNP